MVRREFGEEPDAWQLDVLKLFASGDRNATRIAMRASAGVGKSTILAWCGWNFLLCYASAGEHPKGAALSVTWDNLKDNLWAEMAKWRNRSKLLQATFEWTGERIFNKSHPETWFMSARGWAKTANIDEQGRVLSGLHSKYILFLIDESGDQPIQVLKSAEQALTNCAFGKILQAGNPTSKSGMLYAASVELSELWSSVRITSDPNDPKRSSRVSKEWAEEQIKLYGRDDPWVMSYILGEFPDKGINTLLSFTEVERASERKIGENQIQHAQKRMGIDVARMGMDSTVFFKRQGLCAYEPLEFRGMKSHEIAGRLMQEKEIFQSEMEFVDGTGGFGAGVVDAMHSMGRHCYEVNFSGKPDDPRFLNKRSEMWFRMAEWVKNGGAIPNHPRLKKELIAPQYAFQNGKFSLEPKDMIKKRVGFSPDFSDALALTFAMVDMPSRSVSMARNHSAGKAITEFDPFK